MQRTLFLLFACFFCFQSAFSVTIYVNQSATGANNGTSWADAYVDLQDALSSAVSGDEIWVAQGTYYPTSGTSTSASFQMKNGVDLFGGFVGTETSVIGRDWRTNLTTLSGDIGTLGDSTDNSLNVVRTGTLSTPTRIDGFMIRDGNGGSGSLGGGGISGAQTTSFPIIANCILYHNSSDRGGAMDFVFDRAVIVNCEFYGNHSRQNGGVLTFSDGTLYMINCVMSGNSANFGGAIYLSGGALGSAATHECWLHYCTFAGNHANQAGGAITTAGTPTATVYNSIFWGNTAGLVAPNIYETSVDDTVYIHNAVVEGGYPGIDVVQFDPMFVDADGPDDMLGTPDDNLRLQAGSNSIDAGDLTWIPNDTADIDYDGNTGESMSVDVDGNPRFHNSVNDRGAYEKGAPVSNEIALPQELALSVFSVSPAHPSTIIFQLQNPEIMEIKIMDLRGKTAWETRYSASAGRNALPLDAELPTGVYILVVAGNHIAGVQKFVVD
ncbi:MAG: T9SS type A sorting domain-containing protein [Bacteroidota bacterium]